jgi:hypothetical protein
MKNERQQIKKRTTHVALLLEAIHRVLPYAAAEHIGSF